jgi:hypothetical protein
MNEIIFKLMSYKGSVAGVWRVPTTSRQLVGSIKKVIKFYYRCKESHLLTPELVKTLKSYAATLWDYSFLLVIGSLKHNEIYKVLEEIKNLDENMDLTAEIVEEKFRKHEKQACSLCRTELVYPAYIVWRKGAEIVKQSPPIGIVCLNSRINKLNDLTIALKIEIQKRLVQKDALAIVGA